MAAMWRAASVTVRDRGDDVARDHSAERDRQRDAAEDHQRQDQPQAREHGVGALERAAELDRAERAAEPNHPPSAGS